MSTPIGSATSNHYVAPASPPQVKQTGTDVDGDHDGSKVPEVEPPKATSGSVGTIINTTA